MRNPPQRLQSQSQLEIIKCLCITCFTVCFVIENRDISRLFGIFNGGIFYKHIDTYSRI